MIATRCSPTSTLTSSSRFAGGSGGRFCGTRRRGWFARRSRRWERTSSGFSFDSCVFRSVGAEAVPDFLRPLPPRVPRRRFGRVGSAVVCLSPLSSAGVVVTSVGGAGAAASTAGACSGSRRFRRNQESGKRCLLARRAAERRPPQEAGARAGLSGTKTRASPARVPAAPNALLRPVQDLRFRP